MKRFTFFSLFTSLALGCAPAASNFSPFSEGSQDKDSAEVALAPAPASAPTASQPTTSEQAPAASEPEGMSPELVVDLAAASKVRSSRRSVASSSAASSQGTSRGTTPATTSQSAAPAIDATALTTSSNVMVASSTATPSVAASSTATPSVTTSAPAPSVTTPPTTSSGGSVASIALQSAASSAASSTASSGGHATTSEVFQAAERLPGLSGWTVIPFAHFQRGGRHVVVAWPALSSGGRLVDATVVGICLSETAEGGLEECGSRWVVRDRAAARSALVQALGGSDYEVMTSRQGLPLDELGPRISQVGSEAARALSSNNRSAARQAAMSFSRMLPLEDVAFGNGVAQLLWMAGSYNGRLEHVSTVQNGETATLTFRVLRGSIPYRTIRATARPVGGSSDRWMLVSYE